MDCSPPGSSVHGILQARILEKVAVPFSWGSPRPRDGPQVSCLGVDSFRILVPHPGIEPGPLAVKTLRPDHWTAR